jgi:hypothetical protein
MLLFFKWGGIIPDSPFSAKLLARLIKQRLLRRGIQWRMALASFRGAMLARKMIDQSLRDTRTAQNIVLPCDAISDSKIE